MRVVLWMGENHRGRSVSQSKHGFQQTLRTAACSAAINVSFAVSWGVHHTLDAVFQRSGVEVDQQSQGLARKLEVSEQLRLVNTL
ncbi:MAG: hypothetical protein R8K47_08675 [Mariprofundaceae bacterium]